MIVPAGFTRFSESLRAGVEVFHRLKKILTSQKLSTGVGDEGGFAPTLPGDKPHEQVLGAILQAIKDAGFTPGKEIFLALDCAASEFSVKETLAVQLEEIDLDETCSPYEYFLAERFMFDLDDIQEFIDFIEECTDINMSIRELMEQTNINERAADTV
jgi:enolase